MPSRRTFIKVMTAFVPSSVAFPSQRGQPIYKALVHQTGEARRDYFRELGIKSFINAAAPYSSLGGSQMWPEVVEALIYASARRARMKELHDAVGEKIASLTGSEAAMVTAGAASAMTLGTAACMTGANKKSIRLLPTTKGMPDEVIIQESHRYVYEHAIRSSGASLVTVKDAKEITRAIRPETAMMHFYYGREKEGTVKAEEFVSIGKKHGVPTFCDGATTVPPATSIHKLVKLGFDLVCFSGGKGLKGPYSAGLLLGRRDLIEAARLNGSPHDDTIGRGMKVSKEELLGMLVAVEVSMTHDSSQDWERKKEWIKQIAHRAETIPGVKAEMFTPEISGHQPHLRLKWDESKVRITREEAVRKLREGEPSIEVCSFVLTKGEFELSAWMLEPGEPEIIADRIHSVLHHALQQ
jgi:uncharacterized pyridoxal phosphate-dependent enzyme